MCGDSPGCCEAQRLGLEPQLSASARPMASGMTLPLSVLHLYTADNDSPYLTGPSGGLKDSMCVKLSTQCLAWGNTTPRLAVVVFLFFVFEPRNAGAGGSC